MHELKKLTKAEIEKYQNVKSCFGYNKKYAKYYDKKIKQFKQILKIINLIEKEKA